VELLEVELDPPGPLAVATEQAEEVADRELVGDWPRPLNGMVPLLLPTSSLLYSR
jgi:hypothetical protein